MSRGLFVTGTGTDVGKTYVTALLAKKMKEAGYKLGYYKAALSGADTIEDSDAGFVNRIGKLEQEKETLLSYLYEHAVSPHLASKLEGNPVEKEVVIDGFHKVASTHDYVVMEGSGGIVCPIRYDADHVYLLEDIIHWCQLPALIVADAGLGTINSVVLTVEYMRSRHIPVKGIILNHYAGGVMEEDNIYMIEQLTGVSVLGLVKAGDTELDIDPSLLANLFDDVSK